jgi:hypothetical protein
MALFRQNARQQAIMARLPEPGLTARIDIPIFRRDKRGPIPPLHLEFAVKSLDFHENRRC